MGGKVGIYARGKSPNPPHRGVHIVYRGVRKELNQRLPSDRSPTGVRKQKHTYIYQRTLARGISK
jgi:hypothetical protein